MEWFQEYDYSLVGCQAEFYQKCFVHFLVSVSMSKLFDSGMMGIFDGEVTDILCMGL